MIELLELLIGQFSNKEGVAEMTSLDQLIATMMNVSGVGTS